MDKSLKPQGTVGNSCKTARSEGGCSPHRGGCTDVRSLSPEQIRHFDSMTQWWVQDGHTCASRRVPR